jgi:very-short-patch-repair endonuclease
VVGTTSPQTCRAFAAEMEDAELLRFVRAHHGIATRAELHGLGASDKMIRTRVARGVLDEVLPRVFWLRYIPYSWWSAMRATIEWASPAAGSHRAAAAAFGLDGFPQGPVEVVSARRVRCDPPTVVHRVPSLDGIGLRTKKGLRLTCIERTLLDLAAVCPARKVEQALDDALRQRMTTLERIHSYVTKHATKGRNGIGPIRGFLQERLNDGHTESQFEKALEAMTRRFGLPRPVRQHPVDCGGRTFRFDFAYPEALVAIEAWSYRHHSAREDWEADQLRHRLCTANGWRIVYVTHRELAERPKEVAASIKRLIEPVMLF